MSAAQSVEERLAAADLEAERWRKMVEALVRAYDEGPLRAAMNRARHELSEARA